MGYATAADMQARFGEREVIALSDRENQGEVNADVLAAALDQASVEMDGYLATRYALPLSATPPLLVNICCDMARYRLCGAEVPETDPVRNRYKDAVAMLERISRGTVTLNVPNVGEPGAAGGVTNTEASRVFNAATLQDYLQ